MSILVIEQYFEWARDIADDYAVMDRGAFVLAGTRAEMDEEQVRGRMTLNAVLDAVLPAYRTASSPMASSLASASSGSLSSAAARFSRRWPSDEVPGIRSTLGAR